MKGKRIVISLLSVLLVFSLMPTMVFAEPAPAEENTGEIAIDETNFPDEEFREYINRYDKEHDGILSYEERSSVISILLSDGDKNGIKTVKGIEYFPNLLNLECSLSQIKEIDLSHNTNLEYFGCSDSLISNLDLSANVALRTLWCSNTAISSLDLSNNPNLENLNCAATRIRSLDLTHNTQLETLYCDDTKLSTLDVSKNNKLKTLSCSYSWISALNLTEHTDLEELDCSGTEIDSLNLIQNLKLKQLDIDNTAIENIDLSTNILLEILDCNNTKINYLDVSKNECLEVLRCSNTQISSLDLANNKRLRVLNVSGSSIAYLDLSNNPLVGTEGNSVNLYGDITIITTESTLDLAKQFPGIDVSKIVDIDSDVAKDNVELNGSVLSGYSNNADLIYTYDCDAVSKRVPYLTVIIHIRGDDDEENPPDVDQPDDDDTPSGGDIIIIPPTDDAKPEVSEGEGYSTFIGDNGKTVLIVVDDEYELTDVKVNGVSKGAKTKITGLKSTDKVEVFVITKAEKIQQIKTELKKVSTENYKARSSQVKLKNGKKAVKLTWKNTSGVDFDGVEIFRSFKRYEGFGTKPIFTTEKEQYYNTAVKKGTRYYYKVRGYVEYDGVKYYSGWSAKAWRTVK